MKNTKVIVLTAIVSVGLTVSGSVFSAMLVNVGGQNSQNGSLLTNTQALVPLIPDKKLSVNEQLNLGYKYNMYTGEKLTEQISVTEARFRAIEKRLDELEAKE